MGSGEVIAGVEAAHGSVFEFLRVIYALVYPVPDTSADGAVGGFDVVPVFFEIADGIAHGVGVFADKVRAGVRHAVLVFKHTHAGVHAGSQIGIGPVFLPFVVDHTGVK